jgi:hypothetical protein
MKIFSTADMPQLQQQGGEQENMASPWKTS